jgi:hypothetical protein
MAGAGARPIPPRGPNAEARTKATYKDERRSFGGELSAHARISRQWASPPNLGWRPGRPPSA